MHDASHVRRAVPADIDSIVALQRQIHAQHIAWDAARWTTAAPVEKSYAAWIADLLKSPAAGLVLVAASRDIAGYLVAEWIEESTHHWSPAAVYLHDIYVAPDARRHGYARAMMSELLAWSTAMHPGASLRLTTAVQNDAARTFFAGYGFRACAIEMIRS